MTNTEVLATQHFNDAKSHIYDAIDSINNAMSCTCGVFDLRDEKLVLWDLLDKLSESYMEYRTRNNSKTDKNYG